MLKILCVCLGNICRSPAAEAILQKKCDDAGLEVEVGSAGTGDWHVGELPDQRMRKHAERRGYKLESLGRQIEVADFNNYDYIFTMDGSNFSNVINLAQSDTQKSKVSPITKYSVTHKVSDVPDPYYGGSDGFETVLDILEDATDGFIRKYRAEITP